MNPIIKAIKSRRSIRKFKSNMVEQDKIDQIIEAGLYAASGRNNQGTKIIAIKNKELRDKMSATIAKLKDKPADFDPFYNAPVILVVLADKDFFTGLYDGSLVMGNMMLAAHALELGSCWVHYAKQEFEIPEYRELLKSLGIGANYEGIGHCIIGYPDGSIPDAAPRKENRVYFVD